MFDFEEELKKFQPSPEVDDADEAVYKRDLRDVNDIIEELLQQRKNRRRRDRT